MNTNMTGFRWFSISMMDSAEAIPVRLFILITIRATAPSGNLSKTSLHCGRGRHPFLIKQNHENVKHAHLAS